ncbi:MAG: hypothetical protein WAL22_05460 [Solirubrobacteraceae bacterium]
MTPRTEITVVGGDRYSVDGDTKTVVGLILAAARGSILEFAELTESGTGEPIAVNPEHVVLVRALTES